SDLAILTPGVAGVTDYVMTSDGDENIRATFSSTYTAVGFTAYFNGLGPGTVTVFGAGGAVIGSYLFSPSGLGQATGLADRGYIGFTSDVPMTGFEWDTTNGGIVNTGFSNLSVGVETPLPAALPLFATGLGGLGLLGWRAGSLFEVRHARCSSLAVLRRST